MLVIHEQFLSVAFFTANSNFAEGDGDNTPMLLQSRAELRISLLLALPCARRAGICLPKEPQDVPNLALLESKSY